MDPMQDLPMGFAMALLQNPQAAQTFYSLSPSRQSELINQTHSISSKSQMRALVDSLTRPNGLTM